MGPDPLQAWQEHPYFGPPSRAVSRRELLTHHVKTAENNEGNIPPGNPRRVEVPLRCLNWN
jgi:hypothetical protein